MKLSLILAPLIAAKVPHELIMDTILAFEAQQTDALEKRREADRAKTTRRRSREDVTADVWNGLRSLIFERDGFVCAYCGDEEGPHQIDHIFPLIKGGTSDPDNLCVACKVCNASKRDLTVEEWKSGK